MNGILSQIRTKLLNLLLHVDKLGIKVGDCDSCASLTEIKTVRFTDPEGHLFTIKECRECFQSDWNLDWESYIEDLIILHQ